MGESRKRSKIRRWVSHPYKVGVVGDRETIATLTELVEQGYVKVSAIKERGSEMWHVEAVRFTQEVDE